MTATRDAILHHIANVIRALPADRPARVAIDGVDGAGKTTFADELAPIIAAAGRPVIRASVDGFHAPRTVRYRRGRSSPEGFFYDSYDYAALRTLLLDPLSPGGSRRIRRAAFDHTTDCAIVAPEESTVPGTVLLLDGIFLHRPELRPYWDLSIFLAVSFAVSIPRGARRGTGSPDLADATNQRYIGGQRLYLRSCAPFAHATIVINNDDLAAPRILVDTEEESWLPRG